MDMRPLPVDCQAMGCQQKSICEGQPDLERRALEDLRSFRSSSAYRRHEPLPCGKAVANRPLAFVASESGKLSPYG
jgi:hypothetical protein